MLDDETAKDAIFAARSTGRSIRDIAREFERSEAEVRSVIAEMVTRTYDGERLREDIALENHRLRAISLKYYGLAMDGEGDKQAAAIYVKTSERRMVMLSANAPQAYAVHLSHDAMPEKTNGVDKIEAVINRLVAEGNQAPADAEDELPKPN